MISWLLRRLSARHPVGARIAQWTILCVATLLLFAIALRDLGTGRGWIRPALLLAVLTLVALWIASTGLKRRV